MTSPVFFQEHLTAAGVVRPLFNVFKTVVLAHFGVKCADGEAFDCTPVFTIAVAAPDTNVKRIKVTFIILISPLHHRIGITNVLEKTCGLNPMVLAAPQAPPIVMHSIASLDLTNSLASVGANEWLETRSGKLLVALAWNNTFLLNLLTYGGSDTREL